MKSIIFALFIACSLAPQAGAICVGGRCAKARVVAKSVAKRPTTWRVSRQRTVSRCANGRCGQ